MWKRQSTQRILLTALLATFGCGGGGNVPPNGGGDGGLTPKRNPDQTPGFATPKHLGLGNFDRVLSSSDDGHWALATDESTPSSIALYLVNTTEAATEISGPVLLGTKPDPAGHSWITHDGKYAIYVLNAASTADLHVDATMADQKVFTATGVDLQSVLLSNDQKWLSYTEAGALHLVQVGGASAKTVTTGGAYLTSFSPGSHYLAWVGSMGPLSVYDLTAGSMSSVGAEVDVFQFTPDDTTVVARFGTSLVTLPVTGPGSMGNGTVIASNCGAFSLSPSGRYALFQQSDTTGTMSGLAVVPTAGGSVVPVGPTQPTTGGTPLAIGQFTPDETGVVILAPSATSDGSVAALYIASSTAGSPTMVQAAVGTDVVLTKTGQLLFRGDLPAAATSDQRPAALYLMSVAPPSTPTKVGDDVGAAGTYQTVNGYSLNLGVQVTPDGSDLFFIGGTNADPFSTQSTLGSPVMRDTTCPSPPCASPYYAAYPADGSYIFYLATPSPAGIPGALTLLGRHHGTPTTVVAGARSIFSATPHGDILLYAVHSADRATGGLWRVDIDM